MTNNIYALLVGINTYHPQSQVSSLDGCINDIEAVEAYLKGRIDKKWNVKVKMLRNEEATRQNIINVFDNYICQAESGDVVLFYYAGHGAQARTPEQLKHLDPNGLLQSIVCYDSRTKNGWDLADKELRYLIHKLAQKNPEILVIMDCCHSGTGTRNPEVKVRQTSKDLRERPYKSFIFATDKNALIKSSNDEKVSTLLQGKHIAIAACRSHETAKEYKAEGYKDRGVFSYFLLQTLEKSNGSLTYSELVRNVNALVSGKVSKQSPQLEALDKEDLKKLFLDNAIEEHPIYFTLSYSDKNKTNYSWVIDGGKLDGIPSHSQNGDTLLAIFPVGSKPEEMRELSNALGTIQVTEVMTQQSKVVITEGKEKLDENESYWAIVTCLPLKRLKVYIEGKEGDEIGVELALQVLNKAGAEGSSSLFVEKVNEVKDADYRLLARRGQYWIIQQTTDRPIVAPIPKQPDSQGYTEKRARQTIQRLEHLARWTNILELDSPANSAIKAEDVEMEIIIVSGDKPSSTYENDFYKQQSYFHLEYFHKNGEWQPPGLKIRLKNNSQKTIYCNILNLSGNFAVYADFFAPEKSSICLEPDSERTTDEGEIKIPEEYLKQGIIEYKEIFKLIVSTSEFNASLLEQDELDVPPLTYRSVPLTGGTLDKLMAQVYSRKWESRSKGKLDDWMTKQVSLKIVHPQPV